MPNKLTARTSHTCDPQGETALALAAFGRKEEVVRVLLLSGARRQAVQDAADSDYVAKLARAAGAATAADGPGAVAVAGGDAAGGGGGGGGGQQSARSPGGPAMQFSGTASEYERCGVCESPAGGSRRGVRVLAAEGDSLGQADRGRDAEEVLPSRTGRLTAS